MFERYERSHDSFGGLAVPELRYPARFLKPVFKTPKFTQNSLFGRACQDIRAFCDRDRSFGVVAEGEAGNPQSGRFPF